MPRSDANKLRQNIGADNDQSDKLSAVTITLRFNMQISDTDNAAVKLYFSFFFFFFIRHITRKSCFIYH